mmetsp:Transcript_158540/g.508635  ORF Transcript_158540/g.508635 Transcript_158540/m.508635 type:complete len:283 (+) Transcript_158540:175-1023(+)
MARLVAAIVLAAAGAFAPTEAKLTVARAGVRRVGRHLVGLVRHTARADGDAVPVPPPLPPLQPSKFAAVPPLAPKATMAGLPPMLGMPAMLVMPPMSEMPPMSGMGTLAPPAQGPWQDFDSAYPSPEAAPVMAVASWMTTPAPNGGQACLNLGACPCPETVRACHYESYLCELSLKELERVAGDVGKENFMSRFDHPLLNTLEKSAVLHRQGAGQMPPPATDPAAAPAPAGNPMICDEAGLAERDDCLEYYGVCARNRNRLFQYVQGKQSETMKIDVSPLAL